MGRGPELSSLAGPLPDPVGRVVELSSLAGPLLLPRVVESWPGVAGRGVVELSVLEDGPWWAPGVVVVSIGSMCTCAEGFGIRACDSWREIEAVRSVT